MPADSFHALFVKHWDGGTGRPNDKTRAFGCWTSGDFINALSRLNASADTATVERWVKGETVTNRRPTMLAILAVFFGRPSDGKELHPDRERMEAAWSEETRPRMRAARRTLADEPETPSAADWPRENPKAIDGLVELELFTPVADNQDGYRLRGRLDLGEREDESTDKPVRIALTEAILTLEISENLVTDGSLLGKREPHDNLQEIPGGVRVVGPKREDGCLVGEVFRERHVAVITPIDEAEAKATLRVVAPGRAFRVAALDERGEAKAGLDSSAKNALLCLLFQEGMKKDGAGRIELQKAVLRRKAKA